MGHDDENEVHEPPLDGMEGGRFDAIVIWPLVIITALFRAAEWALAKRRVVCTALVAFVLSIGWIWGISAWNGM